MRDRPYGMGIVTVKQRSALAIRHEPHRHLLATGQHLGFRRTDDGGYWVARAYDAATRQRTYRALGDFRALPDNERFEAAPKAAREWLAHLDAGGLAEPTTVAAACRRYVQQKRRADPEGALDAERRFRAARLRRSDPWPAARQVAHAI
jgi:hypothetical protein